MDFHPKVAFLAAPSENREAIRRVSPVPISGANRFKRRR